MVLRLPIPTTWVRLIVLVMDMVVTAVIPKLLVRPVKVAMAVTDPDELWEMSTRLVDPAIQICIYSFVVGIVLGMVYNVFIKLPAADRALIITDVRMANQVHLAYIVANFLITLIDGNAEIEFLDTICTVLFIAAKPKIFDLFEACRIAAGIAAG